jgi:hypothetical protein
VSSTSLRRTLGFVGAAVGVAGLATGAALLLMADSPERYDRAESDLAVVPVPCLDGRGLQLGLVGRF